MKWRESGQFENPPPGTHIGRCIQVIDLGTQPHVNKHDGEKWTQRDVRIVFELPDTLMEGTYQPEVKGKPFLAGTTLKQSLHPASKLRKILESWFAKKMDHDGALKFSNGGPKKLIGMPALLTLVENGEYVNIDAVTPLPKSMKCPAQVNTGVYFSLDPDEFSNSTFTTLGEKTKAKISASPEWQALMGNEKQPDDDSDRNADREADEEPPDSTVPF